MTKVATCSFPGCEGRVRNVTHQLCFTHYYRQLRVGLPLTPIKHRSYSLEDRFRRYVVKTPGGCWLWLGCRMENGYGKAAIGGNETALAHRVALALAGRPARDHQVVDHLCRVRNCVNPMHLQAVTTAENLARSPYTLPSIAAAKTHCLHGHPFTDDNTYVHRGKRLCRTCRRAADGRRRSAA